jgi:hypothetical protein
MGAWSSSALAECLFSINVEGSKSTDRLKTEEGTPCMVMKTLPGLIESESCWLRHGCFQRKGDGVITVVLEPGTTVRPRQVIGGRLKIVVALGVQCGVYGRRSWSLIGLPTEQVGVIVMRWTVSSPLRYVMVCLLVLLQVHLGSCRRGYRGSQCRTVVVSGFATLVPDPTHRY